MLTIVSLEKKTIWIHKIHRIGVAVSEPIGTVADGVDGCEAGGGRIVIAVAVVVEQSGRILGFSEISIIHTAA